jgi:hypothetical protein
MKQCPQCFRRFPPDLFFCPHDGEPLRIPTGRLEAAGATGTLPRIPWETDSEPGTASEGPETPVFAQSTSPLPPAVHTIFNDGSGGDGATEPFEPIPETGPIRQKDDSRTAEPVLPPVETSPPSRPQPPPPPVEIPMAPTAPGIPDAPPEIPMMAPAYGGPPGRRFADFGTLQPSFAQRFGLPAGFFLVGTVVGAAVGSGLMAVARAGPKFALLGGVVVGLLLGVACAVIGGLLARRG